MSKHLGDYNAAAVIYGKFSTFQPSTGAAFLLAGTPALSVYKDGSTTESTAGVTLTANFDSRAGLNHFAIDTSADGTFYAAGSFFDIVITAGTVDSVSVVGSAVASFTLGKSATVTAVLGASESLNLDSGTAQAGGAATITLRSGASATNNLYRFLEATIYGGTGAGQSRVIVGYDGSTKIATVDEGWVTVPDSSSLYRVTLIRSPRIDATGSIRIQAPVKKNQALNGMPFYMRLNTGGPAIGLGSSITAQRSIEGAAFIAGTLGAVSEIGSGWYFLVSAATTDMNGDNIGLRFSGAGCVDTLVTLFPVP